MTHLLVAITATLQVAGTQPPVDISLLLGPRNYIERQYASLPVTGADYLFLTGEPVQLEVRFVNRTDRRLLLVGPRADLTGAIPLALWRRLDGGYEQVAARFVQDGALELRDATGLRETSFDGRIELAPRATLSVPLTLNRSTEAFDGVYELRVVTPTQARCEPSCVVYNQGGLFRFEIRSSRNLPEQLDLLARRALHAIDRSDFGEANGAIAEMLRIHPRSVVAYHLKARAAEERKDLAAAEESYAAALSLVSTGQDALLLPPQSVNEPRLDAYFSARLKAVQEARRKR